MAFSLLLLLLAGSPASAGRVIGAKAPSTVRMAPVGPLGLSLGLEALTPASLTLPSLTYETLPIPINAAVPVSLPVSAVPEAVRAPKAAPAPAAKRGALPSLRAIEKAARGNEHGQASRGAARNFAAAFDGNAADSGKLDAYRVKPSRRRSLKLADFDPDDTGNFKKTRKSKKRALRLLKKETKKLQDLQQRLYAEQKRSVLVVFQAPDSGGKDGTIRWVIGPLNPQGVRVSSFKKPSEEEARHHYLRRIKKELPKPGMMRVFNRSHYEDILVPDVLKTEDAAVVEGRYDEINAFEKNLAENGVTIVKFFLNISKDEQKRRLQARLDDPEKHWKFDPSDLKSRALWETFLGAYEKVLARTSTALAPWYVIPSNNKWYRSLIVARILRKTLEAMDPQFPPPAKGLGNVVIPD